MKLALDIILVAIIAIAIWGGYKKGVIMGDPNDAQVWERLDDVIDRLYLFENGRSSHFLLLILFMTGLQFCMNV